ncbi:MAG: V-type ATPase 116kDa subunit family protein [Longicatena sp.]|nr:V-type ATPase 116kDa subunit family protein [Longicatena sp.]
MAIAKMKLVNISSDMEQLDNVLLRFIELKEFHPIEASQFSSSLAPIKGLNDENMIKELHSQSLALAKKLNLQLGDSCSLKMHYTLEEMPQILDEIQAQADQIERVESELREVINENETALKQMKYLGNLDVSIDELLECRYIRIHFGRMPNTSASKWSYYRNHPFMFHVVHQDEVYSWALIITSIKYEEEVKNILSSLYFEEITMPSFLHGNFKNAKEMLEEEMEQDQIHMNHVLEIKAKYASEVEPQLHAMILQLEAYQTMQDVRRYIVNLKERFMISGFCSVDDVEEVQAHFADLEDVEVEVRPAHSDMRLTPPTKLKHNWFTKPFSMFVEMYGIPDYDGIDPTPFVAITYSVLFGMMFGDIGQGAVLIILGGFMAKYKQMKLGEIGVRIGIFSVLFGVLFGSVFGNEHLLDPFYQSVFGLPHKPIEIMTAEFIPILLIISVIIGCFLIIVSMSINITLAFKNHNPVEAICSHNGLSGLTFYVSVLLGAIAMLFMDNILFGSPIYIGICIILPLVLMFMKEAIHHKLHHMPLFPSGFGGYFIESFFELFEIVLSFITNTISYLRVGGFVLSHAGMMMAVMLINEMAGSSGWIVLIIGNILVMCLEGMIVGIQVLRLEFYEMFSRYFNGNGIAFKPMKKTGGE